MGRKRKAFEVVQSQYAEDAVNGVEEPASEPLLEEKAEAHKLYPHHAARPAPPSPPRPPPATIRSSATSSSAREYYLNLQDFLSAVTSADNATVETALARFVSQVRSEQFAHAADPSSPPLTTAPSPLLSALLASSPECVELFAVLDRPSASYTLTGRAVDAMTELLSLRNHPSVPSPLPTLLLLSRRFLRSHLRSLHKLISLSDTRLPQSALRLLLALASLSVPLTRELVAAVSLDSKPFLQLPARLFSKSAGVKRDSEAEEKRREQQRKLRSAFLQLLLRLLSTADAQVVTAVLEARGYVTSALRHVKEDDAEQAAALLQALLSVLRMRAVSDDSKLALFSPYTLSALCRLYDDGDDSGHARLADAFLSELLAVVRSEHADGVRRRDFSRWKSHRQLLSRLLSALHPSASAAQQALTLSVLSSFPSLLPSYLQHLSVSFEPRLSPRWLGNVALLSRLLSVRLDRQHLVFLVSEAASVASLSQLVLSHCLPQSLSRTLLSQAVQHKEELVRLVAVQLLCSVLERYGELMGAVEEGMAGKGDTAVEDHWAAVWKAEVEAEMKKRLPDVQVVFGMRSRIWTAGGGGGGGGGDEDAEGRRLELYAAVLRLLAAYEERLPARDAIDMWKLLLVPTSASSRCQLALLRLLRRCSNSPRLFHMPQRSKQDAEESKGQPAQGEAQLQPVSYFGHLLQMLMDSPHSAVRREAVELLLQVLSRTGLFHLSIASAPQPDFSHQLELLSWLQSVSAESLPFLERLVSFVCSQAWSGSAAAQDSASPFSPLMTAALSAWFSSSSPCPASAIISLLCLVLARLLSVSNSSRLSVASRILQLPSAQQEEEKDAAMELKTDAQPQHATRRNELLPLLLTDLRFLALSSYAASLLSFSPSSPSKRAAHGSCPAFFLRLSSGKLSAKQYNDTLPSLLSEASSSAAGRDALLLHLMLFTRPAPLLSLARVQQALAAAEPQEEDASILSLLSSLPVSTLFLQASREGMDLYHLLHGCGLSVLCARWQAEQRSETEQLHFIEELSCCVLTVLQHSASSSAFIAVIETLLSCLQSLVFSSSSPSASSARLQTMLSARVGERQLLHHFLSASEDRDAPLGAAVTLSLAAVLHAAVSTGYAQQRAVVDVWLQRVVDCNLLVAAAPPPSSALPVPLTLLQQFASQLSPQQRARLSAAFLPASSSSEQLESEVSESWLMLLCRHAALAELLLAPRPAHAFQLVARLDADGRLTADDREALDALMLRLLHADDATNISSNAALQPPSIAYLLPESLFSSSLASPSPARLRIVTTMLRSPASPVYVRTFSSHVQRRLSPLSPRDSVVSLLGPLSAYLMATAALPASLLPPDHSAVLSFASAILLKLLLPALRAGEKDVTQQREKVVETVRRLRQLEALTMKQRRPMLRLLLEERKGEERKDAAQSNDADGDTENKKRKPAFMSRTEFVICCQLLQRHEPAAEDAAPELLEEAALLLLRGLAALTRLMKSPAQDSDDYELLLVDKVTELLGGELYLPSVSLPSPTPTLPLSAGPPGPSLHYLAPQLSLSSLVSVSSSAAAVSKALTRFITTALRSRFSASSTHQLVFLLLTLQLPATERTKVSETLSVSAASLLASSPPTPPVLSAAADPVEGSLLTAHTLFDLLLSHSRFLPSFMPVLLPSAQTAAAVASSEAAESSASLPALQLSLLHLLYLLLVFPTSPAPCPAPASLLSLLTAAFTASQSPVDMTLLALLSLLSASYASLLTSRMKWGEAARQDLRRLMAGDASASAARLDEDASWVFTTVITQRMQAGPILSSSVLRFPPPPSSSLPAGSASAAPSASTISGDEAAEAAGSEQALLSSRYSAAFVLPFFLHLMKHSAYDAKKLIDSGVLSFAIVCLSHPTLTTRRRAYRLISLLFTSITAAAAQQQQQDTRQAAPQHHAAFREQPELLLLLTALKNAVVLQHQHLPALLTAFVSRCVPIVMRPSHSLYRAVCSFVAMRPALPLDDVPMLHQLLSSSSATDWRQQRAWMLRLLVDGCVRQDDWNLMRRRHVLSLLMAFHDSRHADRYTRGLVVQLMQRLAVVGRQEQEEVEGETTVVQDAMEGGGAAEEGALSSMVRRHGAFVWLRLMLLTQTLSLQTLLPALELAAVIVDQINDRLPDHAPALPAQQQETGAAEQQGDNQACDEKEDEEEEEGEEVVEDDDAEEVEAMADIEHQDAAADGETDAAAASGGAMEGDAAEDDADAAKRARNLSKLRVGIAQELQLLSSTLAARAAAFIRQSEQQTGEKEHKEAAVHDAEAKQDRQADGERLLSFGFSASSLPSRLSLLSFVLSLLHRLIVTSIKARRASGVDHDPAIPADSILADHSYLDLCLQSAQAAAFVAAAPLLPSSTQANVFQVIALCHLVPAAAASAADDAAVLAVFQWSCQHVAAVGREEESALPRWLRWLHRLLCDWPRLAQVLLAPPSTLSQLVSLYALIIPHRAASRCSDLSAPSFLPFVSSLRLLNNLLLQRIDPALLASQQLLQRLPSSHQPYVSSLLPRLKKTAWQEEEEKESVNEEKQEEAEEAVRVELTVALLLQDVWLPSMESDGIALCVSTHFLSLMGVGKTSDVEGEQQLMSSQSGRKRNKRRG